MWQAEIRCEACGGTHVLWAQSEGIPRTFTFQCPTAERVVSLRYRDPSRMTEPWKRVTERRPGAIEVDSAESRGTFE